MQNRNPFQAAYNANLNANANVNTNTPQAIPNPQSYQHQQSFPNPQLYQNPQPYSNPQPFQRQQSLPNPQPYLIPQQQYQNPQAYQNVQPVSQPVSQPAQYPQFDNQPIQSFNPIVKPQLGYRNVLCIVHNKPLLNICKATQCPARLMCESCYVEHTKNFPSHRDDIVPVETFMDDSIMIQLERLSREELKPFKALDDRFQSVCDSIHCSFDELRAKVSTMINKSEEKAQEKIKQYFLMPKQPRGWTYLKQEYLMAKEAYVGSGVIGHTPELENLIGVMNRVRSKQIQEGTELYEIFQIEQKKLDKLLGRIQEDINLFTESLFSAYKNDQKPVPVKIDPTKIYYDREFKGNHKVILNSVIYAPKLNQLVTGSESGEVTVWDPNMYTPLYTVKVHHDPINALLYAENENLLITASKDKSVRLIPFNEKGLNIDKVEIFKSHTDAVRSLVLLEGEDRFASAGEDPDIRIWHFKSKNLDNIINTKGWKPNGDEMVFIRPERWIVAAGNKDIKIYDYVTRELLITESAMKKMGSLAFLSEKRLLVSQFDDDRIMVWKVDGVKKKLKKEKKLNLAVSAKKPIYFRCFEHSDLIVVSTGVNKILVIKQSNGDVIKEIETGLQSTTCLVNMPGENRIIVGDSGSNLMGVLKY